jgi:hypothetical protein
MSLISSIGGIAKKLGPIGAEVDAAITAKKEYDHSPDQTLPGKLADAAGAAALNAAADTFVPFFGVADTVLGHPASGALDAVSAGVSSGVESAITHDGAFHRFDTQVQQGQYGWLDEGDDKVVHWA